MNNLNKNFLSFFLIPLFLMSGCNKKEETFRTVAYFDQHKDIRESRVKECATLKNMTEIIAKDCTNAKTSVKNNALIGSIPNTSVLFK